LAFAEKIQAAQVGVVGFGIDLMGTGEPELLLWRQFDLYRSGDGSCPLSLQRQHIVNVSLILLGPKVAVGGCWMSCTVMRTLFPERRTVPSMTASAPSSLAMSATGFWVLR